MKYLFAALAIAGVALMGTAPQAGAEPKPPKLCGNHEEYTSESTDFVHTKGDIYKAACAVGRGNGGNPGVSSDPGTWGQ